MTCPKDCPWPGDAAIHVPWCFDIPQESMGRRYHMGIGTHQHRPKKGMGGNNPDSRVVAILCALCHDYIDNYPYWNDEVIDGEYLVYNQEGERLLRRQIPEAVNGTRDARLDIGVGNDGAGVGSARGTQESRVGGGDGEYLDGAGGVLDRGDCDRDNVEATDGGANGASGAYPPTMAHTPVTSVPARTGDAPPPVALHKEIEDEAHGIHASVAGGVSADGAVSLQRGVGLPVRGVHANGGQVAVPDYWPAAVQESYRDWAARGLTLKEKIRNIPWEIGDWLVEGESYGEEASQYVEELGVSMPSLRQYIVTSRAFPEGERRSGVAWSLHRRLAYDSTLTAETRQKWLSVAETEHLTASAFGKLLKGEDSTQVREECPTCHRPL